jgi:hypothetical protein
MEGARALQIVDVLHWQLDFINSYHFVFKVQNDAIFLHNFYTKNEVILWPIILVILDNIRLRKVPFAIGIFKRSSAQFQPYVWFETSHSKYSTTVEPAFLRREAAWVCLYLQRQGHHQNKSLIGPALVFVCSTCYCVGGGDYVWVYPSSQLLRRWSCPQVGLC